jgi:pilus assembly protein Flp/PilA
MKVSPELELSPRQESQKPKGKIINMFSFSSKSKQEKGQGLVEYAIILALVAIVVIGVMNVLGGKVRGTFEWINSAIPGDSVGTVTEYNSDNYPDYQDAEEAYCAVNPGASFYVISGSPSYISSTNDGGSGSPSSCH